MQPVIRLSLLFFLSLSCLDSTRAAADEAGSRPNILFILTDDQAPHSLGAYGNEICSTPNIDSLAARGMRFDSAYNMGAFSGAVCMPSRHMIMSGRTVWHIPRAPAREQVVAMLPSNKDKSPRPSKINSHIPEKLEQNTLGAVFNRAGYQTMRTCKKGNSYPAANGQFAIVRDATNRKTGEDGSAWHADQVLNFLDERTAAKEERPFFVYFGLSHPHDPRYANETLLKKYGAVNELDESHSINPKSPPLPVNYLEAHPFHHGHPGLRDEEKVQGVMARRNELTIRNEKGREYACIENIDDQVGRVLEKLKDTGQLENTIIVYTSDHGIAIGRHGLMGKQSLYEHSWRVPYIVAGPGIRQGKAKGNVYLLDTLATLCDFAGFEPPKTNEGKSFRSVLEGKAETVRDVLYGCYSGGTKPGMRAVRKGDWKLIKYETLDGKVKETQLFNLVENPDELLEQHHAEEIVNLTGNRPKPNQRDLAEDPAFAGKRKELEALLLAEMERLDDPYRFDEGFVNPVRPPRKPKKPKSKNKKSKKAKGGASAKQTGKPNIVYIMSDDLGYGDVQCLNPKHGKIPTPAMDQIAAEGMTFLDAHSGSSVCTPTRYGLLTGRYSWRTRLQRGVAQGFKPCLIAKDRPTVASYLKQNGYETAIIGKWHLDNRYVDPETGKDLDGKKNNHIGLVGSTIPDGPVHRGFDYFHGIHHARSMKAIIENDRVVEHDDPINFLPRCQQKCVEYIDSRDGNEKPFFLYVPLGSPHTPILPTKEWQGKSGVGKYGDFVMQTDHCIGQIVKALHRNRIAHNTIIICTSDNGCSKAAGIPQLAKKGHQVSAQFRGSKADLWDGGHRVPFFVRWPGKVKANSTSDQAICHVDLFATAGEILNQPLPEGSCEDSVSFLSALSGKKIESSRKAIIHHSVSGHFAIREGKWKLLLSRGSGGWSSPNEKQSKASPHKGQLYDLSVDIAEQNNLFGEHPDVVERMLAHLKSDVISGRSTVGPKTTNDVSNDEIKFWKSR